MYKEHYAFEPINENAKIWHYMDFVKFILLLENGLYFSLLRKMPDNNEGERTQADIDQDNSMFEYWESLSPHIDAMVEKRKEQQKTNRLKSLIRVNCWHINEYESAEMWKKFVPNGIGIALQSTFKLLKESFSSSKKNQVHIGTVKYINYKSPPVPADNHFIYKALQKKLDLEFEHELRILISKIPLDNPELHDVFLWNKLSKGRYVPVNVENLLERVVVLNFSNNLLFDAVKSVTKKYFPQTDLYQRVVKSSLEKNSLL